MSYLQRYLHITPQEKRESGALAFYSMLDHIAKTAPSVVCSIVQELRDQSNHLKMIASENYSSLAVQMAMGNLLTDKYAEGHPYHRFYAGCDNVDNIEADAVNELKVLFNCEHAYVQPHSGADANLVAIWAAITHLVQDPELEKMGKKSLDELSEKEFEALRQKLINQSILGMGLGSGGHLTHGYRHNITDLFSCVRGGIGLQSD